ncbi:uncharacterized protein BX664DRAFT_316172 [Halteromyces radiatus]|uniref:uncharacterized protein n=1 Tax=Halteromyces radiatus TaxID=101107 RepID=UPI0022211086|nr:uncharacterized protein BX664DRAFT_316172 [Halteromyces radiatus]KAI8084626.1 hypothetical protein BX664DRAFT_316172 [Halteromyces radiatus]
MTTNVSTFPITPLSTNEEISTIFVVGFPEDMLEREFQNMFIFSPGFEAATLKLPSKDQEDDMMPNNNMRKQIIGFAKFRTRMEALEARDIISGRKVDAEKGSVLKAEMAKKNLHTKRGLSQESLQHPTQVISPPMNPTSYSSVLQQQPTQSTALTTTGRFPSTLKHHSTYEAFYSVPSSTNLDSFSPTTSPPLINTSTFSDPGLFSSVHPISSFDLRATSVGDIFNTTSNLSSSSSSSSSSSGFPGSAYNPARRFSSKHVFEMNKDQSYLSKSIPADHHFFSPPSDGMTHPTTSFTLHQQQQQFFSQTNGISSSTSSSSSGLHPFSSLPTSSSNNGTIINNNNLFSTYSINGLTSVLEESDKISPAASHASLNVDKEQLETSCQPPQNHISSPPFMPTQPTVILNNNNGFRNFGTGMMIGSTNPADQNPPCNTLYVGNLPPNTNEDELKQMFSKCLGYKRLSFRQKSNGPMCFVEFVDVACATQALQDLYGNPLSNSIKGGIRLSFSKNPLGVRQQPLSSMNCNNNNASGSSMMATSPPLSSGILGYNGFPPSMNYPRRESMTFDPQLS